MYEITYKSIVLPRPDDGEVTILYSEIKDLPLKTIDLSDEEREDYRSLYGISPNHDDAEINEEIYRAVWHRMIHEKESVDLGDDQVISIHGIRWRYIPDGPDTEDDPFGF